MARACLWLTCLRPHTPACPRLTSNSPTPPQAPSDNTLYDAIQTHSEAPPLSKHFGSLHCVPRIYTPRTWQPFPHQHGAAEPPEAETQFTLEWYLNTPWCIYRDTSPSKPEVHVNVLLTSPQTLGLPYTPLFPWTLHPGAVAWGFVSSRFTSESRV